jgi:hypothetical protein
MSEGDTTSTCECCGRNRATSTWEARAVCAGCDRLLLAATLAAPTTARRWEWVHGAVHATCADPSSLNVEADCPRCGEQWFSLHTKHCVACGHRDADWVPGPSACCKAPVFEADGRRYCEQCRVTCKETDD